MVGSCGCGVAKPLPKKIRREQLEHLTKHTRLKPAEVKALYARFRRLAPSGYLDQEQFRQTMGVLGLTDDHFLPNRMFRVFDEDQDEKLSFYEFASSLAVMIRGTEDEKLRLSFEMTAGHRGAQGIASEDFKRLVSACNTMMSSLVTPSRLATAEDADRLFTQLATKNEDGVEIITLDAYKDAAHNHDEFLAALGLELPRERIAGKSRVSPHSWRSEERRTTRNLTADRAALEQAAAAAQAQMAMQTSGSLQEGSAAVSESQLEELRGRVDALRKSAVERLEQRRRNRERQQARAQEFKPVPVRSATGKQEEKPRALFGGWWSALECCQAARPEQPLDMFEECDDGSPTQISEASEEGTAVLEEVVSELDGILTSIPRVSRERGEAEGEGVRASHGLPEVNNSDSSLTTPNNRARNRISFADVALQGGSAGLGPSLADGADPGPAGSTSGRGARQVPAPLVDCALAARPSSSREGSHELCDTDPHGRDLDGPIMGPVTSSHSLGARHREEPKNNRKRQRRHRLLGPKKGLAVHFGHENWNMVLSMMIGIRMSVGRVRHEIARELQPVDFIMKEKFSIIPRLANIFDSAVSRRVAVTRFVDYAPLVFQRIRAGFGIQHEEYLKSVGPEQLLGNMILGNLSSLSELSSEGKSGAFFYYTADGKYMMKTVTPKEHSLLKVMLPGYYDHIQKNPDTLLCRFLGLHCLRVQKRPKAAGRSYRQSTQKLYFLVMGNMFNTPFEIHQRYDLKGSWVGRVTAAEDMQPGKALKDVDFTRASEAIRVGPERQKELVEQIERDSEFLRDHNIIDYSLLLGICDLGDDGLEEDRHWSNGSPRNLLEDADLDPNGACRQQSARTTADGRVPVHQRDMGGLLSSDRKSLYFFGIIDILTCYDNAKKMETMLKALYYDPKGVSCCPPAQYSERFTTFMKRAFV